MCGKEYMQPTGIVHSCRAPLLKMSDNNDRSCFFQGHPYPDPSKWTDAELGIPPDSED